MTASSQWYGGAGATFVQVDATHWRINSSDGASFTTSHAIERRVSAHEGLYRRLSLGGNDIIDGRAAPMPSAEFSPRRSNGDTLVDFIGNGAAAGDTVQFVGYGTAGAGATFTQLDATHWRINSSDGAVHDTITLSNGASVHASDFLFV